MSLVVKMGQDSSIPSPLLQTYKNIDPRELAEQVDLVSVISDCGVLLYPQSHGQYVCLCPFHNDVKSPSMRVYSDTLSWWCTTPDTKVLTVEGWKLMGDIAVGEKLLALDEEIVDAHYRYIRKSEVLNLRRNIAPCIKVITDQGEIVVTTSHKFLCTDSNGMLVWKSLELKDKRFKLPKNIKRFFAPTIGTLDTEISKDDYDLGYFKGYFDGDGTYRYVDGQKSYPTDLACWFSIASKDLEGLTHIEQFLKKRGVSVRWGYQQSRYRNVSQKIPKLDTRKLLNLQLIQKILTEADNNSTKDFKRGYLAGIFDAEGTNSSAFGIYNNDPILLDKVTKYLEVFGFKYSQRKAGVVQFVNILGGRLERLRFTVEMRPKIFRKSTESMIDKSIFNYGTSAKILDVVPVGLKEIVEIETSTHTLITNGFVSHNCFGCNTGGSIYDFLMQWHDVDFVGALNMVVEMIHPESTFQLRDIKVQKESEDFSSVRQKIERLVHTKLKSVDKQIRMLPHNEDAYVKLDRVWAWYDNTQVLFDTKAMKGESSKVLIDRLYDFWKAFLVKLTELDTI